VYVFESPGAKSKSAGGRELANHRITRNTSSVASSSAQPAETKDKPKFLSQMIHNCAERKRVASFSFALYIFCFGVKYLLSKNIVI